jgi:hypothetical protein
MIVTTWIWALTWPLYILAPNLLLLGVANAIGFIIVPIYMDTQYSYRLALTGALLQAVGPVATVWIIMTPQVALALAPTLYRPLRQARPLAELRAE